MVKELLFVLLGSAALNWAWSRFAIAAVARNAWQAALISAGITALSSAVILQYVAHPWIIAAGTAGSFAGAFAGTFKRG